MELEMSSTNKSGQKNDHGPCGFVGFPHSIIYEFGSLFFLWWLLELVSSARQ
jgi:hypothetical protein